MDSKPIDVFKAFLEDEEAWDMFLYGKPGTGKTTTVAEFVQYLLDNEIPFFAVAFTHAAKNVLRSKLPKAAEPFIGTLHSFLKKRPTINGDAKVVAHVQVSSKFGEVATPIKLLLVDEFSQVGEKDANDIRLLQDEDYDGNPGIKVLWIGDTYQLPPVGDIEAVVPYGKYRVQLTKIHRTENSGLIKVINELADMLEGAEPKPLTRCEAFRRSEDMLQEYLDCTEDKCLLAYTNRTVQQLNFLAQGREWPEPGDWMFCASNKQRYRFIRAVDPTDIRYIDRLWDDPLFMGSKYKTLEHLVTMKGINFFLVEDEEGDTQLLANVFGTHNHKMRQEQLATRAVQSNVLIETTHKGVKASQWAKENFTTPLARKRSLAWRDVLTFKECVASFDFDHARTIHKSQGATFKRVFMDAQDLYLCAEKNFQLYLRLYYVAVSRASHTVVTN